MKVRWSMFWLVVAALGFGSMAAVLVISRLSDRQLAMLAGAVCGATFALPLGAAGGAYAWSLRQSARRAAAPPDRPAAPPVIYVTTTPAPTSMSEPITAPPWSGLTDRPVVSRRAFNVIGGDELDEV